MFSVLRLYAEDSWRVSHQLTFNYGLRYQTTWGLFQGSGRSEADNAAYVTLQALQIPIVPGVPQRLSQADRASPWDRLLSRRKREDRNSRRLRHLLRRSRTERMGDRIPGRQQLELHHRNVQPHWRPGTYALTGSGCLTGGSGATGNLIGSPYKTPYAIHTTGGVQHAFNEHWLVSADYVHEQGNHGYRGFPYASGTNLFTPLISAATQICYRSSRPSCRTSMCSSPTTVPATTG